MDYYLDPTERYPPEATKWPGMNPVMPILETVFNPLGTTVHTLRDCILISLDAEYDTLTSKITQIGIASLDTRMIPKADNEDLAKDILVSRLFLFKRQSHKKGQYLFGDPEFHDHRDIKNLLLSFFTITDSSTGNLRNIILVGHSIRNDVREIRNTSGISLQSLPTIKAIVDTSPLVNKIYNTSSRDYKLRDMCTLLGMYKRNIHTAGNDAMYTIKALLLLFSHYKEEKQQWNSYNQSADEKLLVECHLSAIKAIGRCNNGVSRFSKQRAKSKRRALEATLGQRREKSQNSDVLDNNEVEGGVVSNIFEI